MGPDQEGGVILGGQKRSMYSGAVPDKIKRGL